MGERSDLGRDSGTCVNPACFRALNRHSIRERRDCEAIVAGPKPAVVVPHLALAPPITPEAEKKEKRRVEMPDAMRVQLREVKRLLRADQPLPAELREVVREYKRLRWAQLTPAERRAASERSNKARVARIRAETPAAARQPRRHLIDAITGRARCGIALNSKNGTVAREEITCRSCMARIDGNKVQSAAIVAAQSRALARLREAHRDEFEALIGEELALGKKVGS